jgi:hypothetical protein
MAVFIYSTYLIHVDPVILGYQANTPTSVIIFESLMLSHETDAFLSRSGGFGDELWL